ncbi:translation initiation factor IF-2-like [Hordeum vulgare subsp. vulgare]|uniref:translation initiation factor IF-2-like n=1 Tax=Hordeum vulgare subsp. vulgare TaxID=112509 RepID=UPI001D1A451C|nr:translation initiation factor IF-2-like [Hordeum vulgare subsp. vulgare]
MAGHRRGRAQPRPGASGLGRALSRPGAGRLRLAWPGESLDAGGRGRGLGATDGRSAGGARRSQSRSAVHGGAGRRARCTVAQGGRTRGGTRRSRARGAAHGGGASTCAGTCAEPRRGRASGR